MELKTAIREAITYCKTHDILAEYFQKNESEVFDMVSFKWDQKRAIEIAKEDTEHNVLARIVLNMIKNMIKKGFTPNEIVEATNLSLDEIRKIAQKNNFAF